MAIVKKLYEEKENFYSFEEHLIDKIIDYLRDSYGCEEVDYPYFFKNFEIYTFSDFGQTLNIVTNSYYKRYSRRIQ